ncbi:MAG: hypothetical protein IJX92_03610 [Clostridia bacterium]|nr:hypothetical protein [Clostridia bacterium]
MEIAYIPEKNQCSIVLIGDFNPLMFQPEWFKRNEIISPEEVNIAENNKTSPMVVSNQITMFKTSQLDIRIEQKRFQVIAEKEPFVVLKDFVIKTFEKFSGLIISAMGLNYSAHYNVGDKSKYQLVGDRLAPKKYWKSLLEDEVSGDDRKSGLISITMQKNSDSDTEHIAMTLQPSAIIKPGIFINCNSHTDFKDDASMADNVMERLDELFELSFDKMKNLQQDLLIEVLKEDV